MLNKCFSFAGVVALGGVVAVWAGCSSDDTTATPNDDAGTGSTLDSGSNGDTTIDSGTGTANGGLDGGVTVTYGTCPTFSKCGGDLVGDWKVTGGCLDKSTFDAARASCPELQESDVTIQAVGTLAFTATETTRDTTVKLTGKVFVPTASATCAMASGQSCSNLGLFLTLGLPGSPLTFDTATCTDTATPSTGCNCDVAKTVSDDATQPYTTTTDGTLTTSSPTQTYDYCINAGSNTYLETTQGQTLKLYITIGK